MFALLIVIAQLLHCAEAIPASSSSSSSSTSSAQAPLLILNTSEPLDTIAPSLFGLDLELTRHDIFNGLSAQLISNRVFAVQPSGTRWPVDWPAGFPPRWTPVGAPGPIITAAQQGVTCVLSKLNALCGVQQAPFANGFDGGMSFGSAIGLVAGSPYSFAVAVELQNAPSANVTVTFSSSSSRSGGNSDSHVAIIENTFIVPGDKGQLFLTWNFTVPTSSINSDDDNLIPEVTLSVVATGTAGTLTLAAVSLLPLTGVAVGGTLRADVVAKLAELGFPGPLRYPGGCFAPFYNWKQQLLAPYLTRPAVPTPPDYCTAVAGGVNAYSDGFMLDGPTIDEYMELTAAVGATPAITVALQFGTAQEIQDAADWVEYLNGDAATTQWGAVRASRGHPQPYNVSIFYAGNEINMQLRYSNYPAVINSVRPPSPDEYAVMLENVMTAMLAADPSIEILAVEGGNDWDVKWIQSPVGARVGATSFHGGYASSGPGGSPATQQDFTTQAKIGSTQFFTGLLSLRDALDAAGATNVSISADEWGLGPPWDVVTFNVAHGMYGASLLSSIIKLATRGLVKYSNYFEPINEGAIQVEQFTATLTPLGEVMQLYAAYAAGGNRVAITPIHPSNAVEAKWDLNRLRHTTNNGDPIIDINDDVDAVSALMTAASDARKMNNNNNNNSNNNNNNNNNNKNSNDDNAKGKEYLLITLANRNSMSSMDQKVLLTGNRSFELPSFASFVMLPAQDFTSHSTWNRTLGQVPLDVESRSFTFTLPPYSIAQFTFYLGV